MTTAFLMLHSGTVGAGSLVTRYSTFIGTPGPGSDDSVTAVAADVQGNIYLAGTTKYDRTVGQAPFPTTPDSLVIPDESQATDNPCVHGCGFVLKLDPQHRVVYGVLIHDLDIEALAVDKEGSAYATGRVSGGYSFPATPGAFSNDPVGQAFVLKLNAQGSALQYCARFIGEEGKSIAVDSAGNAYIAGFVETAGLPTTPGSIKPAYQSTGETINKDGFLIKVDPSGQHVVYGTYLGGAGTDRVYGAAVDGNGIASVVDSTDSTDFLSTTSKGADDAFVARISADGKAVLQSSRLGGRASEYAAAVANDPTGGIVVAGATESDDFPVTAGVLQSALLGERNGFVARFDTALQLQYLTYFGGGFVDGLLAATVDEVGNAYLAGVTFSPDMLTTTGAFQTGPADVASDGAAAAGEQFRLDPITMSRDAFVAALAPDGRSLSYGSYLGGFKTVPRNYAPLTLGAAIARGPDGKVFVGGSTTTADFPVTGSGITAALDGLATGFLTELELDLMVITDRFVLPDGRVGHSYRHTLTADGGAAPYRWSVVGSRLPEGLTLSSGGTISGTMQEPIETGGYQFTVKAVDTQGHIAYKSLHIATRWPGSMVCADARCALEVTIGQTFFLDARIPARGLAPFFLETAGVLPPGLTENPDRDGSWVGAPTMAGTYSFTSTVSDSTGKSASLTWDITVKSQDSGGGGGDGGGGPFQLLSVIALLVLAAARRGRTWLRFDHG